MCAASAFGLRAPRRANCRVRAANRLPLPSFGFRLAIPHLPLRLRVRAALRAIADRPANVTPLLEIAAAIDLVMPFLRSRR